MKEDIGEMKSDIKNVVVQTTKTNGRVTVLEVFMNTWKGKTTMIALGLSIMGTFIVPLVKKLLNI